MNQEEYQAMQERENAIAQLEVQETQLQREMREEEDRELAKLENDITTMAEVFVETQRLVTEQGEVVGKLTSKITNSKFHHVFTDDTDTTNHYYYYSLISLECVTFD